MTEQDGYNPLMPTAPSRKACLSVLFFYLCAFILTSGGRLGSVDAGSQLQATLLLVSTGSLGTKTRPSLEPILWVENDRQTFYECHDIGSIALMLPAAWIGSILHPASGIPTLDEPPAVSRVAASLTYALLSAVGCFFLFLFFARVFDPRTAFLLSVAFAFTTFFWAYTKTAWDVMGASVGSCLVLYGCARILTSPAWKSADFAFLAFAVTLASSFRFSLFPSLLLGFAVLGWLNRDRVSLRPILTFLATLFLGMLPTFLYNWIRMGNPFRPATMTAQFASTSDLQGNIFSGFYGLLLSPNKGLFWFAPILLLIFATPWTWRRMPQWVRRITIAIGATTLSYLFLIAKIRNWGTFGWGPRYLVPVLPFFFVLTGMNLVELWKKYRNALKGLLLLSFLLNLAPALVNWSLAIADAQTSNPYLSFPYQHLAIWKGLWNGLAGTPLPAPDSVLADPVRSAGARFPDLWTVRLMETSAKGRALGALALILLMWGMSQAYTRFKKNTA